VVEKRTVLAAALVLATASACSTPAPRSPSRPAPAERRDDETVSVRGGGRPRPPAPASAPCAADASLPRESVVATPMPEDAAASDAASIASLHTLEQLEVAEARARGRHATLVRYDPSCRDQVVAYIEVAGEAARRAWLGAHQESLVQTLLERALACGEVAAAGPPQLPPTGGPVVIGGPRHEPLTTPPPQGGGARFIGPVRTSQPPGSTLTVEARPGPATPLPPNLVTITPPRAPAPDGRPVGTIPILGPGGAGSITLVATRRASRSDYPIPIEAALSEVRDAAAGRRPATPDLVQRVFEGR
jgi:hypothetical protein